MMNRRQNIDNEMETDSEDMNEMQSVTFVNVKASDKIIFDTREPVVVFIDVMQPVVKLENCIWLA